MPKDRDQQTPAEREDRSRLERTRGRGTAGTGGVLLPGEAGDPSLSIELMSASFDDGDTLPPRYAHDGDNVSPPLEWTGVPPGTAEVALLCVDPDAPGGTFVHWVLAGIDPGVTGLAEGEVPPGTVAGVNGFGEIGWGGPQPPPGHGPHRYVFSIFASSAPLDLTTGASADDLREALTDRQTARGELVGMAERT